MLLVTELYQRIYWISHDACGDELVITPKQPGIGNTGWGNTLMKNISGNNNVSRGGQSTTSIRPEHQILLWAMPSC